MLIVMTLSDPKNPNRFGLTIGALLAIAAFALVVRLAALLQCSGLPFIDEPVGDARGYLLWAQEIAAGNVIGESAFYQAPLYPYALAAMVSITGLRVLLLLAIQCLWGSLSAILMALSGSHLFGPRVGVLSGLIWAAYAPAIFFDGIIQKASLAGLLTCALVFLVASISRNPRRRRSLLLGLVIGLLALTRENALAWIPVLMIWLVVAPGGRKEEQSAESEGAATRKANGPIMCGLFALGAALVLLPVGIRNAYVGGEFSISTFQAGPNFYIGNHSGATGRYVPLVRGHETPQFERTDATQLAEADAGRQLSPNEVSRYWLQRAWKDIKSKPLEWMLLLARKSALTWNAYEVADVESLYVSRQYSSALSALTSVVHFGTLFPLALMGAYLARNEWKRLAVIYILFVIMSAAVAAFYMMARYRFPLAPLMVPFAAFAIVRSIELIKLRRCAEKCATSERNPEIETPVKSTDLKSGRRELVFAFILGIVGAAFSNYPMYDRERLDALAEMNMGVAFARQDKLAEAERMFARSVATFPGSAEARNNLAQVLAVGRRYAEAIPHYEVALDISPGLPGANFNLAVALEQTGQTDAAIAQYQNALQADPNDRQAAEALSRLGPIRR
ncbi:MAG: tetratricopeptide repeat protein [Planctomycetota bacterium]|jgi:tetratricopeptide (TPR) repeat protein